MNQYDKLKKALEDGIRDIFDNAKPPPNLKRNFDVGEHTSLEKLTQYQNDLRGRLDYMMEVHIDCVKHRNRAALHVVLDAYFLAFSVICFTFEINEFWRVYCLFLTGAFIYFGAEQTKWFLRWYKTSKVAADTGLAIFTLLRVVERFLDEKQRGQDSAPDQV